MARWWRPAVAAAALLSLQGCATSLPLERYRREPVEPRPTEVVLAYSVEEVWQAVLELLSERGAGVALADRQAGRIATGWVEAPSLIYRRERVGTESDTAARPVPARYRLEIRIRQTNGSTRVAVEAEEQTNFLILSGVDRTTGREYTQDRWRPTPTFTAREDEFLQELRRRFPEGAQGAWSAPRRRSPRLEPHGGRLVKSAV